MLDRSKCKKMLVWDNQEDIKESDAVERIVIDTCEDGSCICVDEIDTSRFTKGLHYNTTTWDNYKPIPEPSYRPFETLEEFMPYSGNWFRLTEGWHVRKVVSLDFNCSYPIMFTKGEMETTKSLCDSYEMLHNNEWVPAGIKEDK